MHAYVCVRACVCSCVHACVCVRACVRACVRERVCACVRTHEHTRSRTHARTHAHIRMHARRNTRMHARTHTHARTNTHTSTQIPTHTLRGPIVAVYIWNGFDLPGVMLSSWYKSIAKYAPLLKVIHSYMMGRTPSEPALFWPVGGSIQQPLICHLLIMICYDLAWGMRNLKQVQPKAVIFCLSESWLTIVVLLMVKRPNMDIFFPFSPADLDRSRMRYLFTFTYAWDKTHLNHVTYRNIKNTKYNINMITT
jgi:hypothetical protein